MRVLMVSAAFPPHNGVGAVRVGKLARFLVARGHDVRVLSVSDSPRAQTLGLEIPREQVTYTRRINVNWLPEVVLGGRRRVSRVGFGASGGPLSRLGRLYKTLFNVPDDQAGWIPFAFPAGLRMARDLEPDAIYGSGGPWSSLIVAYLLHRRLGVPWFAELRDPWTDNPLSRQPWPRRNLEEWIEHRALSSAAGLVTVSEPWAAALERRFDRPVVTVRNGFDPDDVAAASPLRIAPENCFTIVHTGLIHPGKRDPSPLFDALRRLGPPADPVRVAFIGTKLFEIPGLAASHGVGHLVSTHDSVPHKDALGYQAGADMLLLLLADPEEADVYPAKLFEYAGARRPILLIGPPGGVAARLITSRGLGLVTSDPAQIAARLGQALAHHGADRQGPRPHPTSLDSLTREEQFSRLEDFMATCLSGG